MPNADVASRWHALASRILDGTPCTADEALAVLEAPDVEVLDILGAAYKLRHHHYGNTVKFNYLVNAKSGLCPEDCGYCSQSRCSDAPIDKYALMDEDEIIEGAERAVEMKASTCCIVISGRGPSKKEVDRVATAAKEIKKRHPGLKICACLGILRDGQAEQLKEAGVDRYNHNVNTAASHHDEIVSTHSYDDRVSTVEKAKESGISPCSGVIVGMGESNEQVVESALALRELNADSIPVNFLIPVEGTPMEEQELGADISPQFALKVLAMFRFVNPDREIRISAGREVHLRTLQPMALYAANALFVSDYLTEPGQAENDDWQMIEDLGFEIEQVGAPMGPTFREPAPMNRGDGATGEPELEVE